MSNASSNFYRYPVSTYPKANNEIKEINVDNSQSVLERMSRIYAEKLMSDVTLIVNGIEYPSHRLILCATSDVFQVMLLNPVWTECGKSSVTLQETPECCAVFASFLKYFYTGQIAVTDCKIIPLLSLADKYNVKSLEDICLQYMRTHIAHSVINNQILQWHQYTSGTSHSEEASLCFNFIKWNLELIAQNDLHQIDPYLFLSLLQQNDLIVFNENTLFLLVAEWLKYHIGRIIEENESINEISDQIDCFVFTYMSCIRFPMMTPRQLADMLLHPLIEKYKEFFFDRITLGMSFHCCRNDLIQKTLKKLDGGKWLFEPRLYTSDLWCSLLTIDNFSSIESYYTKTFMFSSRYNVSELDNDRGYEWLVELYPKGVWFRKCLLIIWQGTKELPESILRTVRLTITCKELQEECVKVKIGILISGCNHNIEHIVSVKERICHFTPKEQTFNIDDLIPFNDLNPPAVNKMSNSQPNPYLVGETRDTLKMQIVISHLHENLFSST